MNSFSFENLKTYAGLFFAGIGVLGIFDADWLFGDTSNAFNMDKIGVWVTFFGRNTTRFIVGSISLFGIIMSLVWFWYDFTHQQ